MPPTPRTWRQSQEYGIIQCIPKNPTAFEALFIPAFASTCVLSRSDRRSVGAVAKPEAVCQAEANFGAFET